MVGGRGAGRATYEANLHFDSLHFQPSQAHQGMSLSKLPYEIINLIVEDLELDDVFHLSLSARFSYLVKEDRSSGEETIVDVRALLDEAIAESRGAQKYKFQNLHYAEGIVSCLYTHSRHIVESWLVVFSVREQRFPVAAPKPKTTERAVKDNMWRRQHAEGPIDDRWSFIRLLRDERDPKQLQVLESRKEWFAGSPGRRTYYTTPLVFPEKAAGSEDRDGSPRDPGSNNVGGGIIINPATDTIPETFLDLVDDPDSSNSQDPIRRLRLRAGCCKLCPAAAILADPVASDVTQPHLNRAARLYESSACNEITFWPPAAGSIEAGPTNPTLLAELYRVVHPPQYFRAVKGAWDERSLVYSTGLGLDRDGDMQALVFVSFDPSTRLPELKEWGDECLRRDSGYESGYGEEEDIVVLDHWTAGPAGEDAICYDEAGKGKGKQQVAASPLPDMDDKESVASTPPQSDSFPGWTPEALFTSIGEGAKGKVPADAVVLCDRGGSSAGDLGGTRRDGDAAADSVDADADALLMAGAVVGDSFSTNGEAFSSFSSHYSTSADILFIGFKGTLSVGRKSQYKWFTRSM
ncbi:hypothetical protein F5883DRAFT_687217 [Diaporthe sp. PMI_573]|nr:hypothetical protein F5883DRAFT_687217 [Diaporthaceae sp. PMI_573]